MLKQLLSRFKRHKEPVQLSLPFHCEYYGEQCGPFYRPEGYYAFYNVCWKCGVTYDPVNDR